jgi:hypothetical protein
MGISVVCYCLVWVEKSTPLRRELDTQCEIDGTKRDRAQEGREMEGTVMTEILQTATKA